MNCPTCKKNEYTVSQARGFTKYTVNECIRCNTIWIDRDNKAEIIYINGDKNGL